MTLSVEIWSPLPPQPSGIADYVHEQLETLDQTLGLTLVAEDPDRVDETLRQRYRIIPPQQADRGALRCYHIGNSPLHGFAYLEALRIPGVVVLHEWNLHELLLGFAVTANNFDDYRRQVRREHGERGSIAAETIATALGGRHWTSVFPLNAQILEQALGVVCPSASTAAKVAARVPGTPVLHLPHHALLRSSAQDRAQARVRLGFDAQARIVLAPGLGTVSKSLGAARAAMATLRGRVDRAILVTVGGGADQEIEGAGGSERAMGRVELTTLGDALLAADVILALRFPSRGETSGVLMRAIAAGRAAVVSRGSTAEADLPEGMVARVSPGPAEASELAAVLEFLLTDDAARVRMEKLASDWALTQKVEPLAQRLAGFLADIALRRPELQLSLRSRQSRGEGVRGRLRDEIDAAAASLGLSHLPPDVFEKLAGL